MKDDLNFVMVEGEATPAFKGHFHKPSVLVCRFTVRSARHVYSSEHGGFVINREELKVMCFGSLASLALDRLGGGGRVRVMGSFRRETWIGGDGYPQQDMVIVASDFEILAAGPKEEA